MAPEVLTMPERDLVKTGIQGLDDILAGGLLRGSIVLVEGTPGTGKTTLGMEFIYRGVTEFNEPGLIALFEVSPLKIMRDSAMFGWDFADCVPCSIQLRQRWTNNGPTADRPARCQW
jgi:KaiC/GvpD/RAD55 family RecA-like ATPase